MADAIYVPQRPLVDADGNINVHGREGIVIPFKRYTDLTMTQQIDISGDVMTFEVDPTYPTPNPPGADTVKISLTPDPGDALGLLLTIPDLHAIGLYVTPDNNPPFALRDTTGTVPIVRWSGRFVVYGWEDGS